MSDYESYILSDSYINSLRSGVQGYQKGKPIISIVQLDETVTNAQIVTAYDQRISTYKTLNGRVCGTIQNLERSLVNYGVNTSTSCIMKVTRNDIANSCQCLRRLIFNKLNYYFVPSTHISTNGNPKTASFDSNDWVRIYPTTRTLQPISPDPNDLPSTLSTCQQVPYKATLSLFTSSNGKSNGIAQFQLVGAFLR